MWRYLGVQSYHFGLASFVVAGLFNAQRTKRGDRVWTIGDFHPLAKKTERRVSADEVNARFEAHLAASGQQVVWLEE